MSNTTLPRLALLIPLMFGALFGAAEAREATLSARLDDLFSSIEPDHPGCNVGVLRDGEWLHKRGYGRANMELDVPLDGSQVHRMGSVSKQFTATAVLLLAEEGLIDLDE